MAVLNKSYQLSHSLWEEITSPDIDVDRVADLIVSNIDRIRKVPQLSRCGRAFGKIKESVGLLKSRFSEYYRDFISTQDSTIMMQHFIIDVSKTTTTDIETTRQFKQILNYYRKLAGDRIKDPRINALFGRVDETMREIERGTENLRQRRDENSAI